MTLSREDGQLYYKLWLPMLDFVNRKYRINRKLNSIATAIELDPAEFEHFMKEDIRQSVYKRFKDIGFTYIALDILGYRTGSMNEGL